MAGWITINGTHVFVKEGESVEEAFARTTGATLSTKNNPEQSNTAKKFSLKEAMLKARDDRDAKDINNLRKAMRNGDTEKENFLKGKIDERFKKDLESEEMTEKGKEARKAREAKAKEDIKKDAAKSTKGKGDRKLDAPTTDDIFAVGSYKGYNIDQDDESGRYSVQFAGDEVMFKTTEEAMDFLDENVKGDRGSNQTTNDNIRAATGRGGKTYSNDDLKDIHSITTSASFWDNDRMQSKVTNFVNDTPELKSKIENYLNDYYKEEAQKWKDEGDEEMYKFVMNDLKLSIEQLNNPNKSVGMDSDPRYTLNSIIQDFVDDYIKGKFPKGKKK